MKILMINKFLYKNGGSETYILKLGDYLRKLGNEVQYFGMEHNERCVGNRINSYAPNINFHDINKIEQVFYSLNTIYSKKSRIALRKVLEDFSPDVCHINNFNFQLTPSIILEIVEWRKKYNKRCNIIYTAHDYQLVCPNHMLHNPVSNQNCEACLGGKFINCVKNRCIHKSIARSCLGMIEAQVWNSLKVYRYFDKIICCSDFLKQKLDSNPVLNGKTICMHNFIDKTEKQEKIAGSRQRYVLYFGRYSEEKGINVLLKACSMLPDVNFIFAGNGPLKYQIGLLNNVKDVGFQSGNSLNKLIMEAQFSICPSIVFENCPFSVMESQQRGVPVIGARIGGIPELIEDRKTGRLFESGNFDELAKLISELWNDPTELIEMKQECLKIKRDNIEEYSEKIIKIYADDYPSQFN